ELVTAWTLFSSLLNDQMRRAVAHEIARVVRPDGAIGWYDMRYRNRWNPRTLPISRSELKRLFPGFRQDLTSVTLLPPLARTLPARLSFAYWALASIPMLRTHHVGLLVHAA